MRQCTSRERFDYIIWTGDNEEEMRNFFLTGSVHIEFKGNECHIDNWHHLQPNHVLVADKHGIQDVMSYELFIRDYKPEITSEIR